MFRAELHYIIISLMDAIEATNSTWTEAARAADLCYATVARLRDGKTRDPKFQTIWKLSKLVGLQPILENRPKKRKKVSKPRKLRVVG